MPRRAKGPRLYLQPARGKEAAVWVIRDGATKRSTGFSAGKAGPPAGAQDALKDYIASKTTPRHRDRDPATVEVASVIAIYAEDIVPKHARPKETAARLANVLDYFGSDTLSVLNRKKCDDYVKARGGRAVARRELEDLRAAIRHHWEAGLCSALTPVVLPDKGQPRERWLTRKEAARLLLAAWRLRQKYKGQPSDRATAQHVARFILVALYTGTRAGAICGAALEPTTGRGWVDLDNGVFYRRPAGKRETKKRQPAVRLPPRLLAHLRRWKRLKLSRKAIVEWNGAPVKRINKAFRSSCTKAKLGRDVFPHILRHTAITWQAQVAVPVHEICGFFGVSREVFEQTYAHHHPDYQRNAVNAFARQIPDRLNGTERERGGPNVVKLA